MMYQMCNYVVGNYNCPVQIGNRLFVILNAYLCSQIYNVPLLWEPNVENGPFECNKFLHLNQSVLPALNFSTCERSSWPYPFTRWKTWKVNHAVLQKQALLNGFPRIRGITYCGRMERAMMSIRMAQAVNMSSVMKDRIRHIFRNGMYYAYGNAFNTLFQTNRTGLEEPYDIGLHLRMNNPLVKVQNTIKSIRKKVKQHERKECRIFVSSDNAEKASIFLKKIGSKCTFIWLPRSNETPRHMKLQGHGDNTDLFMKELIQLSNSNVFISVKGSSASELISSLSVYNGKKAFMCDSTTCSKLK